MKTNRSALLDVNFLIALLDPNHEFHDSAHAWFGENRNQKWATCPITENGCVRILSKPGYPNTGLSVAAVREILAEFCLAKDHVFWPDSTSVLNTTLIDLTGVGPKNLTDIYLLSLAVVNHGRLVTFDGLIRWQSVSNCSREDLVVLAGKSAS
jgi:toxin-antitoxin system PIN domain toxin